MNKKHSKIGAVVISGLMLLSIMLLLIKHITIETIACLLYNALTLFCTLIWSGTIKVNKDRRKSISIILWYFLLWTALFTSLKTLMIK